MSVSKADAFDAIVAAWDTLVVKTNNPLITQQEIDDEYKIHDDAVIDAIRSALPNHPGPPPPRRRPS